jgi:hypothetical protein
MKINNNDLPSFLRQRVYNFLMRVKHLHPKRGVKALQFDEPIFVMAHNNGRVSALNDNSTTVIQFINIKNDTIIPIRDKLPDIPRKDIGIKELEGVLSFEGLGDSYNLDYGTYYEKLARGINYSVDRQEILLSYDIQYGNNSLAIHCPENSPVLNTISLVKNYSNMSTEELAVIALLKRKQSTVSFPIQNTWRKIFGEDSWRRDNELIQELQGEGLVKMEKIPKLTGRGKTFLSNLQSFRTRVEIPYIGEGGRGDLDKFLVWYQSNKGKKLEDFIGGNV